MISIRRANISDAKSIAKIHVLSWQVIYRGLIPDKILENLSIDEREKLWTTLIENNANVLVLEENDILIGFVSFCSSRDQDAEPSDIIVNLPEGSAPILVNRGQISKESIL